MSAASGAPWGDRFFVVCSDVHGSAKAWRRLEAYLGGASFLLHCGDLFYHGPRNPLPEGYDPKGLGELVRSAPVPVVLVRGNCDAPVDQLMSSPRVIVDRFAFWWDRLTGIAAHGDDFSSFRQEALAGGFRLALSGHTHVASVVREGDTVFVNPGSLSLPKGKDPASFGVITSSAVFIVTLDGEVIHSEPL
jgi:putative phosphoesterase